MKLLEILKYRADEVPKAWGVFHLLSLLVVVATLVLFIIYFKNASDKKYRKLMLVCWCILLFIELYKELTFRHDWNFDESGKLISVTYNWYLFPYQFCSTPFYIFPFIIFGRDGKVRNACMSFVSTFVFFAGIIVLFMPQDVYVRQIGICIQTTIQHGLQFCLGVVTTLRNKDKLTSFKKIVNYCWPGIIVFACMASVAILLNEVVYHTNIANGETFNMFFISKHYPCTLLFLDGIYNALPYPLFLISYLLGFTIIAGLVLLIQIGAIRLVELINAKLKTKKC